MTRTQRSRTSSVAIVALLYLLLTLGMTWPMAQQFNSAIPGDGFDGWQNYWNLWWVKAALVDRLQFPFQTDLLYAPTGVDLYFHTLNPFNGLVTLPIQLSSGLIQAYNTVVLLSWTLGGLGVYLLTRWVLREPTPRPGGERVFPLSVSRMGQRLPPFLAGLIFTFAPFHMAHLLGHMQVMSLQWIPFYILYLMRSLDKRRKGQPWLGSSLLAGLFLVLCGLCDWYFVLYLFFFTGLLIVWHLLADMVRSGQLLRVIGTWLPSPLVAGLCFLILLSPLLIPMVQTASELSFMVRPESDFYILSASVADFLIPNRLHTLFRNDSFGWIGNQIAPVSERTISIGYIALILALFGIGFERKRAGFWAASALYFGLMALGPVVHFGDILWSHIPADPALELPPELAAQLAPAGSISGRWSLFGLLNQTIPFMEISRSVSRYALMVQLCIAVLAGIGLSAVVNATLFQKYGETAARLAMILPILVLMEYWVAPFPMSPPDTPAVYSDAAYFGDDQSSILNLPMNFDRPGYLLYQTVHQNPLAVAYISRDDPRTLTERLPALQHFRHLGSDILTVDPAAAGLTIFSDIGIGTVVLDRYKMPGGHEREYTTTLAHSIFDGISPTFEDDRITIYSVPPMERRTTYLALGPLNWGPLRKTDDIQERSLLDGPAELWLIPGDEGADLNNSALQVQYRTSNGVSLTLAGSSGNSKILPPTEEIATARVPLNELIAPSDMEAEPFDLAQPLIIQLAADRANAVWITQIGIDN